MKSNNCKKCGECCTYFDLNYKGEIKIIAPDILHSKFKEFLLKTRSKVIEFHSGKDTIISFRGLKKAKQQAILRALVKCVYLKDNRCSIYKDRPDFCKEFYCGKCKNGN